MSKAYKVGDNSDLARVPNITKKHNTPEQARAKDVPHRDTPYNGWANYDTWKVANVISNNEHLYDLCKHFYLSGYKSYGALRCKLHEYGPKWKVDGITEIYWDNEFIRAKEITALMHSLFNDTKPKSKPTK